MRYLILGAGPAGLAFANQLMQDGEDDFLVLEKEETGGGLCRSTEVDGAPFDIGGGHFLDVRRPMVNEFLFHFLPKDEWQLFERRSLIEVNGTRIGHPMEANIWQLDIDDQVEYLKSIAVAGCNQGTEKPAEFIKWIYWKLGERIASDYMIPYNQKMFGDELNQLGTYWLDKLPNVSFEDTLRSCLMRKAYGSEPGHAQFYYPKRFGYGELWLRMAKALGNHIEYSRSATELDAERRIVRTSDGTAYHAKTIITTIPWAEWECITGMPDRLVNSIKELKHSSIVTQYFPEQLDTTAQWIYYPDPDLSYHRILVRHNFCPGSRGYWTETNAERFSWKDSVVSIGSGGRSCFLNPYAYPLNTRGKPQIMDSLLDWCRKQEIYGLGRWGEHQHYNSDAVVERAVLLARELHVAV